MFFVMTDTTRGSSDETLLLSVENTVIADENESGREVNTSSDTVIGMDRDSDL